MMMNRFQYFVLLFSALLGILLLTPILGAQEVLADWNPAGMTTISTYEVIPTERRVHVTILYHLKNLNEETRSTGAYYTHWTVPIPLEATNIKAYDSSKPVSFTTTTDDSRIHLKLKLNRRLSYGKEYDFSIEYDLAIITQSVATIRAYGKGSGSATVNIMLPREYYDEVIFTEKSYITNETDTHIIYTYTVEQEGYRFSTLLEAAKKSDYQSLSGTVRLQEREVKITVEFWEDEMAKAQRILNLYLVALPILEDVIGVPFPPEYDVIIQEVTKGDTKGWGGRNRGMDGILISYKMMETEDSLVHELAHYWAVGSHWKETWMHEGYAELYTYLTHMKIGNQSIAEKEIMEHNTSSYEENKDQYELILSTWSTPDVLTEEDRSLISFGYNKSFVFTFNLYNKYGAAIFQEVNQKVYKAERPVDWFDYLYILEDSTGEELGPIFADWVLTEDFSTDFNRWQSAERSYRESEQLVIERKNALGISIIEVELAKTKALIMNGDFSQALSQLQSTTALFQEWETAEKAIRDAEAAFAQAEAEGRTWRLTNIESAINQAKDLIENGRLEESLSKSQFVQEKADNNPTPWLAIPILLAPYLSGVTGLAYWIFGFMTAIVLAALILAILVSVKTPKISRDSFRNAFKRSLKINFLAFALILGLMEYLDKASIGTSIGLAFVGALLGIGSILLGCWLLPLIKRLPFRTEFSKDTVYGMFGSIIGSIILAPVLDIPLAAGLILGLFGSVLITTMKTSVRNLFSKLTTHNS